MRLGVVSDVHGNLSALEAALAALREAGARRVVCCGDLVGRGPQPRQVVDRILGGRHTSVRGTFDDAVARGRPRRSGSEKRREVERTAWELGGKRARALGKLPQVRSLRIAGKRVLICHGTPRDPFEHLHAATPARAVHEALESQDPDVLLCGGSHEPFVRWVGRTLVVNAGTTGASDDGDVRAHAALVEVGPNLSARILRVPYDLRRAVSSARRLPGPERKIWVESVLGLSVVADRGADVALDARSPASDGAAVLLVAAGRPLSLARPPRRAAEVRELRQSCLRLRDLLASFGSVLPQEAAQALDRKARKLYRALAAPRNAAAAADAMESLGARGPASKAVRDLTRRLRAQARDTGLIERALSKHGGLGLATLAAIAAPAAREKEPTLEEIGARAIASRAHDCLTGTGLLALPSAHAAHHDRRKAIRRLRLSLELFGPWTRTPAALLAAARAAETALGRVRDLALAEARIRRELRGKARKELLESLAERRLLALRDAASLDERLLSELRARAA